MDHIAFVMSGLVVGTAVGATGVGGGSLMTPLLILVYGVNPAVAVGTDLMYASISKSFGVLLHGRNGTVDWKLVWRMALGSVPACLLALLFLHSLKPGPGTDRVIKATLALAIVTTSLFALVRGRLKKTTRQGRMTQIAASIERNQRPLTIAAGAVIGALVTLSSVGAGALGMVVLLLLYPRQEPIKLVGSDLAHAVLITAIAGLGHASMGTVDYKMLVWLLTGALPGIWLGTRISFNLPAEPLKRVIAGLLVFVGGTMAAKAF